MSSNVVRPSENKPQRSTRWEPRVHYMAASKPLQMTTTGCGMSASREKGGGDDCEAETTTGFRIKVTQTDDRITCYRCRRTRKLKKWQT